jgi:hypothetical protein
MQVKTEADPVELVNCSCSCGTTLRPGCKQGAHCGNESSGCRAYGSLITHVTERKKGGMRKWMFMEPYWSDIDGQRFLTRFVFFFTPWAGCHVTRIHMADDQREYPHDHSATFWSWKLWGTYDEDVYDDPKDLGRVRRVKHRRFGIHRLGWDQAHSITRVSPVTVTMLFLARRRNHSGYWTPEGKQSLNMTMDKMGDGEWS